MLKNWFLPLFVIMGLVFAAAPQAFAQDQAKYGVVDMAKLMRDSAPGKAGIKFIETQQAAMQKRLDEVQAKLEKDPKDQALMQELQRVYASSQQKIQAEGQNAANAIFDVVQKVVEKFRKDNGYAFLMSAETLVSFNPDLDVTAAVLKELDKEKVEFKPLPEPEAKAPSTNPAQSAPAADSDKKPAK